MLSDSFKDIRKSFTNYHVVGTLAWQDIATRYKRSRIGAFWLTIGMAVSIAALGFVFGNLFKQSMKDYLPYLAIGTIFWGMLSSLLNEGGNSFVNSSGIILQVRLPLFIHVLRVIWCNILILGHNILILPFVFLYYKKSVEITAFLAIPGFILFVMNTGWIMLTLAVICSRFRDFGQIVQNVLHVLYFFTPIMWDEKLMPSRTGTAFLSLNPFYHLISVVRTPLLGGYPTTMNWTVCAVMMFAGWGVALLLYGRYRKRIPYWL
jgi:lipopolysaccharide transport system permease protein